MNPPLAPDEALALVRAGHRDVEPVSCVPLRRGCNDHYLVEGRRERYVYRVYLDGKYYIGSRGDFEFELKLLEFLDERGVPVARPVRRDDGALLGRTSAASGARATALFEHAPGAPAGRADLSVGRCVALGRLAAELHLAADRFSCRHDRYHLDLELLLHEPLRLIRREGGERAEAFLASLPPVNELVEAVGTLDAGDGRYGLIHADLHGMNMHFDGDRVTLFDFDHCAHGWRAYDLATAFHLADGQRDAVFEGYDAVRPLSRDERDCLPVFARLREIWNVGDALALEALGSG